jgi:hypothetical protein
MAKLPLTFSALLFVARLASAQAPGSIEGDVYLLNKLGDVKKGAAGTVGLVSPGPRSDSALLTACATLERESKVLTAVIDTSHAPVDGKIAVLTSFMDRQYAERIATLAAAGRTSPTGMNAHYEFTAVPAGRYYLVSSMAMGDETKAWLVPVLIKRGQHLRVDLDNNNVGAALPKCDAPPPSLR